MKIFHLTENDFRLAHHYKRQLEDPCIADYNYLTEVTSNRREHIQQLATQYEMRN